MTATTLESHVTPRSISRQPARRRGSLPVPSSQPARILCVDDHPIIAEGLRATFAQDGSLCLTGHLTTAMDLLEVVTTCKPDLILLDIEMPGPDIFEIADRLRHRHPGLRFAFLSSYTRDGYLAAACRCGAWGYFSKSDLPADLIAGIKAILRASRPQFTLGPAVASHLPPSQDSRTSPPAPPCHYPQSHPGRSQHAQIEHHRELHAPVQGPGALTGRELEVLHLIGKGLTRLEIASELSRSVKTIDGHQDRIMRKLGASCRSDLLRYAIREGYAEA